MLSVATEDEVRLAEQAISGNPNAGDEQLYVRFYVEPVHNPEKSAEAGRPIFDDEELCEIRVPGDKDNTVKGPAGMYRDRFRSRYDAWKAGFDEDSVSGVILREWPGCTRSQAEELSYFNVRTVEQLAGVSDGNLQGLGPGYLALRAKAKAFLAASKDTAATERMRLELAKRDGEIEVLRRALAEQNEQIKKIQDSQQTGRKG